MNTARALVITGLLLAASLSFPGTSAAAEPSQSVKQLQSAVGAFADMRFNKALRDGDFDAFVAAFDGKFGVKAAVTDGKQAKWLLQGTDGCYYYAAKKTDRATALDESGTITACDNPSFSALKPQAPTVK